MARLIFFLAIAFLPGHTACAGTEPPRENTEPLRTGTYTLKNSDPLHTETRERSHAEPHRIGRLFFSPDERAILDRLRKKNGRGTVSATEQMTLNGIVRRSSGKTTTWINQLPQHENETPQGIAVHPGQASKPAALLLLPSGRQINLKAGQTFDTTKGKVREGYESGSASYDSARDSTHNVSESFGAPPRKTTK